MSRYVVTVGSAELCALMGTINKLAGAVQAIHRPLAMSAERGCR